MNNEHVYKLLINIAYPSIEAPETFSEHEKSDLNKAIERFNQRFRGKKQLEIDEINVNFVKINLLSNLNLKNPTREISAFSQILYNDFNWKKFSEKENRMFDIKLINIQDECVQNTSYDNMSNFFVTLGEKILNCSSKEQLDIYIKQLDKLIGMAKSKKELL